MEELNTFVCLCFTASLSENVIRNDTFHEIIRPVPQRFAVGSAGASRCINTVQSRQRTLINPFKPNEIPCNWTCNRHRWSHVFPKGPGGEVLHRHYEKLSPTESETHVKPEKVRVLQFIPKVLITLVQDRFPPELLVGRFTAGQG